MAQAAADQSQKQGAADRNAGQSMTVTGCLQPDATSKDTYKIASEDGKTWALKSSSVKLGDHLNHKVTVTGKTTSDAGELNVSNLKMVSQTCQ